MSDDDKHDDDEWGRTANDLSQSRIAVEATRACERLMATMAEHGFPYARLRTTGGIVTFDIDQSLCVRDDCWNVLRFANK